MDMAGQLEEAEELLSVPAAEDGEFSKLLARGVCSYENLSQKFRVVQRNYARQYAQIYFSRIQELGRQVEKAARKKWGDAVPLKRLMDLKIDERCWVIGTLFKKMDLKPSILKEISATHHLVPQPPRVKYVGTNDSLVLEDQMQRATLCGNIPSDELVTGIVVAVLGAELRNGSFEVEDYCFAGLPEQDESAAMETDGDDRYVVLISGLNLGSSWCDQLSVEMFVDYVTGQLGAQPDQRLCSNIVRVIIVGDSITDKPAKSAVSKDSKQRFLSRNYTAESTEAMKELDQVLSQLVSCVPTDVMPGSHDPTNYQLPQQPLHKCMFPHASRSSNLSGVTNPYQAEIGGLLFLGSSGQCVEDIFKYSIGTDRLSMLESTLRWRHMAPTAPDTLACYPYYDRDPFILDRCPHVYFCGNQPSFQHKTITGDDGQTVLLINIPSFDLSHSCVLVNLDKLECSELSFSTTLERKHNPELERLTQSLSQLEGPSQPEPETSFLNHMDSDEDDD